MAGEHQEGIRPQGVVQTAQGDINFVAQLYRGEIIAVADNNTDKNIIGLKVAQPSPSAKADLTPVQLNLIKRVTTTTTLDETAYHWFCNTDAGAYTVTLPAGEQNQAYRIINTGTSGNTLTVAPNGSENLLGANSSFNLSDKESLVIIYDTTDGWF